jgi:hypothetical protein
MSNSINPESTAVQSYLNILQGVISRMAANSGNCKTWCITLASALLVLIADKGKVNFTWIALIPVLLFAFLDAYYLGQERAFRETYNDFVNRMHSTDMEIVATTADLFQVKPRKGFNVVKYTFGSMTSFAIYPFYSGLLAMIFLAYWFIK